MKLAISFLDLPSLFNFQIIVYNFQKKVRHLKNIFSMMKKIRKFPMYKNKISLNRKLCVLLQARRQEGEPKRSG